MLFPHPVLRPGGLDYTENCKFDAEISNEEEEYKIRIRIEYHLNSEFLTRLIHKGKAKYLVMIKCDKTGQRLTRKSDQRILTWDLDKNDFRGKLLFSTYIVAESDIEPFMSDEHHPEIRGIANKIPNGSILAMGNQWRMWLDKTKGSLGSAIRLVADDRIEDGMYNIDLNDDFIKIVMSRNTLAETKHLRIRFPHILLPMLYITAVENAIRDIKNHEDKLWAGAIEYALERHGYEVDEIDEDNYNEIAQKLMDKPYKHVSELLKEDVND